MLIYRVIGLLFGAGVVYNLCQVPRDWPNIGAGFGIVACMSMMSLWLKWNVRGRRETLRWLRDHKDEISEEGRYFSDSPFPTIAISRRTKLRKFKIVTSMIMVTTIHDVGGDLRGGVARGAIATLWTLAFGWWAIPWGPIRTLQALTINLSGGEKQTVHFAMLTANAALQFDDRSSLSGREGTELRMK